MRATPYVTMRVMMIPATMRVTAKSAGSIATASATVVTFNIGEPTTNASTN